MTQSEWDTCTDPLALLDLLRGAKRASDRKLRLFAVACYRRWPLWRHDRYRGIADVAERHAEGTAGYRELQAAFRQAFRGSGGLTNPATAVVGMEAHRAAAWTAADVAHAVAGGESAAQAELVRCVFGPPRFDQGGLDPSWRTPTVLEIAGLVYDEARFELTPALGAALSDAGCFDTDILGHCGGPGPHVRGCWAIDLLLNKA
jgi:hypothetical protein